MDWLDLLAEENGLKQTGWDLIEINIIKHNLDFFLNYTSIVQKDKPRLSRSLWFLVKVHMCTQGSGWLHTLMSQCFSVCAPKASTVFDCIIQVWYLAWRRCRSLHPLLVRAHFEVVSGSALLQRIFLTQGTNLYLLCLLHWQAASSPLHHLRSRAQTAPPAPCSHTYSGPSCLSHGGSPRKDVRGMWLIGLDVVP